MPKKLERVQQPLACFRTQTREANAEGHFKVEANGSVLVCAARLWRRNGRTHHRARHQEAVVQHHGDNQHKLKRRLELLELGLEAPGACCCSETLGWQWLEVVSTRTYALALQTPQRQPCPLPGRVVADNSGVHLSRLELTYNMLKAGNLPPGERGGGCVGLKQAHATSGLCLKVPQPAAAENHPWH